MVNKNELQIYKIKLIKIKLHIKTSLCLNHYSIYENVVMREEEKKWFDFITLLGLLMREREMQIPISLIESQANLYIQLYLFFCWQQANVRLLYRTNLFGVVFKYKFIKDSNFS